jgi:hypothetical protein
MKSGFLEFVYDFYKSMKAHEIKLVYEGRVTQQITKAFIALAEAQMKENAEDSNIQRRVFHVMVECLQNISRHADEVDSGESQYVGKGIFMVSRTEQYWCVTTGNAIFNEKVKELKEMIEQVNELNVDELKDLYVRQMKEGRLSTKGGAGLGFIDIRRKTNKKLDYHFLPITDKVSFFLLTTYIPRTS